MTIFLALLLPAVLIFSGVCLEYARASAAGFQTQAAASSAAQSVFAGYSKTLFSDYGLMARLVTGGDFSALSEESGRYASAYGGEDGGSVRFQVEEALWQDVTFVTDGEGEVFAAMASEAMRASAVSIAAQEWLERLGLSGGGEQSRILKENASKEDLTADSLLSGYEDLKDSLERAEAAAEKEEEEEEDGEASETETAEEESRSRGHVFLDLLESVRTALNSGILGLVIPNGKTLSEGEIPTQELPSALPDSSRSRSSGTDWSSFADEILVREYLVRNLSCFTSEKEKSPAYELEYVLAGKSTDKANLKSVVNRLLWIRTGMNLLYLAGSSGKKTLAREAAALAVGWTGLAALVEGMSVLLLTVWAFSEAFMDVRTLLGGGKVALTKTDENWQLSFDRLAESWTDSGTWAGGTEESDSKGLSYEDYLRICLYLTSEENACWRGMDVIQWNVRKSDANFVLSNCIVSGTLILKTQSPALFGALYASVIGLKGYEYSRSGSYSYFS